MDDCRCLPLPSARISIICAGQSDRATAFAATPADFRFLHQLRRERAACGGGCIATASMLRQWGGGRCRQRTTPGGQVCGGGAVRGKVAQRMPTMRGAWCSYGRVAALLDEYATLPGVRRLMPTFNEFNSGMDKFGQHIQPLMASRGDVLSAAKGEGVLA